MNTLQMEVALMQHFGIRNNYIVPNVSWGIQRNTEWLHECDLLVLSQSRYATEVEIKVSMADLKKDQEKGHGHSSPFIKFLYFAVPLELYEKGVEEYVPERAGIIAVKSMMFDDYIVKVMRKPKYNKYCWQWTEKELFQLLRLGTMRIYNLKYNLLSHYSRKVKNSAN